MYDTDTRGAPGTFFAFIDTMLVVTGCEAQSIAESEIYDRAYQRAQTLGRPVDIRIGQIVPFETGTRRTVARYSIMPDGSRGKQSKRRNPQQRQRWREQHGIGG